MRLQVGFTNELLLSRVREKTKLEIKLLVRRGLSRNMGPERCLKGFILHTLKRET